MADKELKIRLRLDRSQPKQAAQEHVQDAQMMEDASRKASKAQGDAAKRAGAEVVEASGKSAESIKGVGVATQDAASRFALLAAGSAAFRSITGAASAMLGVISAANVQMQSQVDKLIATKNLLRDLSSMTGSKGGSTDAEVSKHLAIRTASGLDDAAAKALALGFSGSGEAKKGINISPEEFEKAKPLVARFAAANSMGDAGAAGTYGELAGMLLGFRKNATAKDVVADIHGFNKILSLGVGDNPVLVREAAEQAGAVLNAEGTGIVKNPNQLAALIATASMKSPKSAGNTIMQVTRALRDFSGPHAALLAEAGITEKDDDISGLEKINKHLEGVEKTGKPIDVYLGEKGMKGMEDKMALATMYNYRSYLGRFLEEGAKAPGGDAAIADIDAKFRDDLGLRTGVGAAKLDEAKMHSAMMVAAAKPLMLEAEARLEKRGEGMDSGSARWTDWRKGFMTSGGGTFLPPGMTREDLGRKIRVEEEMFAMMKEKGIDIPDRPYVSSPLGGYSSGYMNFLTGGGMESAYAAAIGTRDLGAAVGGPVPMTEVARKLDEANRLAAAMLEEMRKKGPVAPTPMPAALPIKGPPPLTR